MVNGSDIKLRLEIESGPERGRQILLPADGVRVGRDSANDVVIRDPSLSRFQCRVYFGANGELRVADLGSTNTTEVNGARIQDVQLLPGDWITIGETIIRLVGATAPAEPIVAPAEMPALAPQSPDMTDLGLGAKPARPRAPKIFWLGALAVLVLAGVVVMFKVLAAEPRRVRAADRVALASSQLDIQYEKVQATSNSIFRYELNLHEGHLFARLDNLDNARHVTKEQTVDGKVLEKLALALDNSGFFDLPPEFTGLTSDPSLLESYDMTITLGARTHRCRVANRLEPEDFTKVRSIIEEFGRNEIPSLLALPFPPDKLIELARNATLQGQKLFDEQNIKYANLSSALKSFQEADVYLETIEPKPDFYAQVVAGREDCKRRLQDIYDDRAFRAERAIKLRDWKEASNQLRVILELIPDREDTRHQQAQTKLLDVERHLDIR